MNIQCNAGTRVTNRVSELPGFGTVWFDRDGLANILSLKSVQEMYHVSYNSSGRNKFVVTKPTGEKMYFHQSNEGLYYLDIHQKVQHDDENPDKVTIDEKDDSGFAFVNMV